MRRGVALMSVLIVLTLAALAGTGAMLAADGSVAAARGTMHRAQGRALAWSGVQAVMQEIAGQRDDLLQGGTPTLTIGWTVYESPAGRGVVRLLPLRGEELAVSECAKLDLNAVHQESLAKLPGVGKELAAKIVGARPFSSPLDLLRVEGITPELLTGRAEGGQEHEAGGDEGVGLVDLVTTFGFDPNVQNGVGEHAAEHRGQLRLNVNSGLIVAEDTMSRHYGEVTAIVAKVMMEKGRAPGAGAEDADAVDQLVRDRRAPADWGPPLDALTTGDEPFLLGRVDVNAAPAEVLACVPGIDADAAPAIVAQREQVRAEDRRAVAWLYPDLLDAEALKKALPHLTTRSMVWRVRVEAGVEPLGSDERDSPALADRVVLEAVIDVSSRRARVAYLRDVTHLDAALALRSRLPAPDGDEPAVPERADAAGPQPEVEEPKPEGFDFDPGEPKGDAPGPPGEKDNGGAPKAPETGGKDAPAPEARKERPAGSGPDRRTGRWTTGPKQGGTP